jgi:hypothetical protein
VKGNGHVQVETMGRIYVLTERPPSNSIGEREVRLELLLENGLRFYMQGKLVVEIERKGMSLGMRHTRREVKMIEKPRRGENSRAADM